MTFGTKNLPPRETVCCWTKYARSSLGRKYPLLLGWLQWISVYLVYSKQPEKLGILQTWQSLCSFPSHFSPWQSLHRNSSHRKCIKETDNSITQSSLYSTTKRLFHVYLKQWPLVVQLFTASNWLLLWGVSLNTVPLFFSLILVSFNFGD